MTTKERGGSIKKLSTAMRKRLFSLTEEAGGEGGEMGVANWGEKANQQLSPQATSEEEHNQWPQDPLLTRE